MSNFAIGLNSALNSYRQAEHRHDEKERRDRAETRAIGEQEYRREVDAENRAFRDKQFDATQDYRNQQLAISGEANKFNQGMASENLKLRQNADRRAAELQSLNVQNTKQNNLKARALQEWKLMEETGRPFSKETHEALIEQGMTTLSPYSWRDPEFVQDNLALGPLLASVQQGDLAAINRPENLQVLSKIYKGQLQRGIGESKAPLRTKIVDKELAGFRTVRDQHGDVKIVPLIRSVLEDGSTYDAPITLNRSTDPDDPVEAKDATLFLDDAMGRFQMAQMAQNKDAMSQLEGHYNTIFGVKPVETKPVSSQGKLFQDLIKLGEFSEEDAKKMAFESENNKADFVRKYVLGRTANLMPGQENAPTADDFRIEALKLFESIYPENQENEAVHGSRKESKDPNIQRAFSAMRNNPANKQISDEDLWAALNKRVAERGIN